MPGLIQRLLAGVGLVLLAPLILGLAVLVRLTSPGPAFHRATRVRPGGTFTLYKLRSMGVGAASSGAGITSGGDRRVTRLGRILRRTKLDELPQLWNVVRGDMLLVGPRPEDPRYVDHADPLHTRVFGTTPGITGAASVEYRDEERILAATAQELAGVRGSARPDDADVERAYRDRILPAKLAIEDAYLARRSTRTDLDILRRTLFG